MALASLASSWSAWGPSSARIWGGGGSGSGQHRASGFLIGIRRLTIAGMEGGGQDGRRGQTGSISRGVYDGHLVEEADGDGWVSLLRRRVRCWRLLQVMVLRNL